jgi:hypothetical protein
VEGRSNNNLKIKGLTVRSFCHASLMDCTMDYAKEASSSGSSWSGASAAVGGSCEIGVDEIGGLGPSCPRVWRDGRDREDSVYRWGHII